MGVRVDFGYVMIMLLVDGMLSCCFCYLFLIFQLEHG